MTEMPAVPNLFVPSAHLSDTTNREAIESEIEGGVHLPDLSPGTVLAVHTRNHIYTIVTGQNGEAWISGHPEYCPDPVLVKICGSTWGGSMLRKRFIGRGMRLEFRHPEAWLITTSPITDVQLGGATGDAR